jgi:hypothetical protein
MATSFNEATVRYGVQLGASGPSEMLKIAKYGVHIALFRWRWPPEQPPISSAIHQGIPRPFTRGQILETPRTQSADHIQRRVRRGLHTPANPPRLITEGFRIAHNRAHLNCHSRNSLTHAHTYCSPGNHCQYYPVYKVFT